MKQKLTLSLERATIERVKAYAQARGKEERLRQEVALQEDDIRSPAREPHG